MPDLFLHDPHCSKSRGGGAVVGRPPETVNEILNDGTQIGATMAASEEPPMHVFRYAVIALFLCSLPVVAQDADRFESAAVGFSLKKPAGWSFVPQRRGSADVSAEELQKAQESPSRVQLVEMHRDGQFGNFGVSLIARSASIAHASPKQVLEYLVLPGIQKSQAAFALESVRELELSGHPAAEYVATDTVRTAEHSMPVRLRTILVPRGKFFFLIDMTAPVEGYEQWREVFDKIVASMTIEK